MIELVPLALLWRPAAPPLQILAGALLLVALAVFAHARTFRSRPVLTSLLLVMRLAMIVALTLLFMGPSRLPPETTAPGRPRLTVLVDTSASMLTADCQGQARIERTRQEWLGRDFLTSLRSKYELRMQGLDAALRPLSEEALAQPAADLAAGHSSNIADGLSKTILDAPFGSQDSVILLLSDGHDSTDAAMLPVALLGKARGVLVNTVCFGGPTEQRDLALVALPRQEYLLAGEPGQIVAQVYQAGLDRATTVLRMTCGAEKQDMPVEFQGRRSVSVVLPVKQDAAGLYEYAVSVDPVPGEAETGNNRQSVFCEVTARRISVLLLEGEPYWDTKFLAQSLRNDARIELTQIAQVTLQRRTAVVTRGETQDAAPPKTLDELAAFDVVILGRGLEHLLDLPAVKLLPEYVADRGGHVLFARGRAYDPDTPAGRQVGRELAVIEPVVWEQGLVRDQSISLTAAGRASPCFSFAGQPLDSAEVIARLPGFTIMSAVAREKASAVVLARVAPQGQSPTAIAQSGRPGVTSMDYGRGRVVAILGEGLWRWGLLPPEMRELDGVYDAFWSNMVRWLAMGGDFMPGQDVSLKLGRSSLRLGDSMLIDVGYRLAASAAAEAKLTITDPDGKAADLATIPLAGMETRRQANVTPKRAGVYTATLDTPTLQPATQQRKFSVYDIDLERLDAGARPADLQLLAEQSGGRTFADNAANELLGTLAEQQRLRLVPPQPEYLWDTGGVLLVLVLWIGTEWLSRRRAGWL